MLVCLPYSRRDCARATALLRWIAEQGNVRDHDIILFPDENVDWAEDLRIAQSCFRSAKVNPLDLCNTDKWPFGANHCFKRVVDLVDIYRRRPTGEIVPSINFKTGAKTPGELRPLWPMLFLETDAIPLYAQWLNDLQREWDKAHAAGKHFMGYLEYAGDVQRQHMNGVGIYDDVYRYAPKLMTAPTDDDGANYMAFDWAGGPEVVPQMHATRLIQFQYKKESELMKDETLSWLNPDAAIFHTCKDVRIFDLLRARQSGVAASAPVRAWDRVGSPALTPPHHLDATPSVLTCDIFIKTYDKVADWHAYSMRSIERFCSGFRRTVVVGQQPVESYQAMQVHKLNADLYTDADFILFTDSDCVFSRNVTPQTFMEAYTFGNKSIWLHRSWESALGNEGDAVMRWKRGMQKFFGQAPREFMCRHPEMIPRWLLSAFRIHCLQARGVTMEQWVMENTDFADWNMLGCYAWLYHREAFHWIDQDAVTPPPMTLKQYWGGHTPIEPHIAEMEAILAGGVTVEHAPPGPIQRALIPASEALKPFTKKPTRRAKPARRRLSPEHKAKLKEVLARARETKAAKLQKA